MEVDTDVEGQLLQQFSSLGTNDKEVLIIEFQNLVENNISPSLCAFYLDMNNWNLPAAIGSYYDNEQASQLKVPVMSFIKDVTIGEGEAVPTNTSFIKTWRIQNSGHEGWPPGCCLRFVGGEQFGTCERVMVDALHPSALTDVSVEMRSPSTTGIFHGQWRMQTATGLYFGEIIWVILQVEESGLLGLTQQLNNISSGHRSPQNHSSSPPLNPFASPNKSNNAQTTNGDASPLRSNFAQLFSIGQSSESHSSALLSSSATSSTPSFRQLNISQSDSQPSMPQTLLNSHQYIFGCQDSTPAHSLALTNTDLGQYGPTSQASGYSYGGAAIGQFGQTVLDNLPEVRIDDFGDVVQEARVRSSQQWTSSNLLAHELSNSAPTPHVSPQAGSAPATTPALDLLEDMT